MGEGITMEISPRKEFADLPKTVHGGQAWRLEGVEDYSQNLNPLGPPSDLDAIIAGAVKECGHYPDADSTVLKEKIAKHYGLSVDNIAIGAGSSEIIRNFPYVFVSPGDSVLMFTPSFAEYTQQCRLAGAQVDYIHLKAKNDFRIDLDELFAKLKSKHYRALYICNPNNPTGRIESRDKLREIIRFCEEEDTMVFLDETLLPLCSKYSLTTLIREVNDFTNLLIAESFTKSFAIPGLRIGYAISNPAVISELEKARLPWNLGTIEQAVAVQLTEFEIDHIRSAAHLLAKESDVMRAALEDIGLHIDFPSDSFFYFIPVDRFGVDGAKMTELMLKGGIMVRDCASFGPEFKDYIRFCVKDRARNDRFVEAMANALKSLGF